MAANAATRSRGLTSAYRAGRILRRFAKRAPDLADTDRPDPASPAVREVLLDAPGSLRLASDGLPWQRSLRWEKPARNRRVFWLGLAFAFFVTVLELGGFALGMRSYHGTHARRATAPQVITVQLIEPPSEVPPPPPEPEPEPQMLTRPSRVAIAPPQVKQTPPPAPRPEESSDAMRARIGAGASSAPLKLFNADGSVRIGSGDAPIKAPTDGKPKTERDAAAQRWAQIETRGNPLDCKKTRFAGAFAPDISTGDKVASKYLKWIGLADGQAIAHRAQKRAESGGCEDAGP